MLSLKKGSLALSAMSISTCFTYYLSILFKGVEIRSIVLSIFIEGVFLFIFMIFTSIDFVTGIQAAFHINAMKEAPLKSDKVIKSSKLWRTFWKSFGIIMLTVMLTFLAMISTIMTSAYAHWVFIWSLIAFWIMACGFEFYSIGENLAKRNNGIKPRIFGFTDNVLDAIQRKTIDKIDDSFNILDDAKDKKK